MIKRISQTLGVLALCMSQLQAQNIGINTPTPSQPLEVGGIIFTNQGGVMYPDSIPGTCGGVQGRRILRTSIPHYNGGYRILLFQCGYRRDF